jgi:phosphate starvation-inducible PhoH-like protein
MSKSARRYQQENKSHEPKQKWENSRVEFVQFNPLRPMNQKQRTYMELITTKDIVIATGLPGTSKTYLAVAMAADLLRANKINQIVLCRPNVSNSPSLGMWKGSMEEKCMTWLVPVLSVLRERMGAAAVEIAIKNQEVVFQPLETIKGLSLKDAWLIVDEAEDVSIEDMQKIITRTGENCKLILAGDIGQSELKEYSGLTWFKNLTEKHGLDDMIGVIDFNNINDVVRSETTKRIVAAMQKEKRGKVETIVSY